MRADPGLLLADGRYQLITRIAVGGMGEVWRAHDLWTDGPVAIKVLRPEYTGDPTSLQRLRIEAHNASMLVHPNIAAVHDYREQEGTGYLVMEYVDGQSMADVLASHSTIAPLRLLPILIQASLGLHAAHTAGVVHRDVKPGNILLGPSDQVKLTDFGISIAQGQMSLTDTGKVMGTAQYLAPEQALGNPATPLGDLYALGIIAYESLVGERPFTGVNHVAIALSQVRDAPPPLPSSVEPSLAELVMRLLSKDPAERPQTGADLAAELSGVLDIHRQLAGRLLAARRGSDLGGPLLRTEASAGRTETHDQPPTFTPVARDPVPPTEVADLVIEPISAIDLAPELLPQPTSGPIVQVPVPDVDQPAPAQAPAPAPVALAAPSGEVDLPVIVSPPVVVRPATPPYPVTPVPPAPAPTPQPEPAAAVAPAVPAAPPPVKPAPVTPASATPSPVTPTPQPTVTQPPVTPPAAKPASTPAPDKTPEPAAKPATVTAVPGAPSGKTAPTPSSDQVQDQPAPAPTAPPAPQPGTLDPDQPSPKPPAAATDQGKALTPPRPPQPRTNTRPADRAPAKDQDTSWVRQWLVPALIALALIAMIVIGLITALRADPNTAPGPAWDQMTHSAGGRGIIDAEQLLPASGCFEEG